jgi:hypothetical protein
MSLQTADQSLTNKLRIFFSENKAISVLLFLGSIFVLLRGILIFDDNPPYLNMFLLFYLVMVWMCAILGSVIFVYNISSVLLIFGHEPLTSREEKMKRNLILRSVVIPVVWIVCTFLSIALLNDDICITGAVNCYLLAAFLFFLNEWENPFSEKFSKL